MGAALEGFTMDNTAPRFSSDLASAFYFYFLATIAVATGAASSALYTAPRAARFHFRAEALTPEQLANVARNTGTRFGANAARVFAYYAENDSQGFYSRRAKALEEARAALAARAA